MLQFIIDNWELLSAGILTPVLTYFIGTKKRKINEKTAELENLKEIRDMEKQLVLDAKKNVEELVEVNNSLNKILKQKDIIIANQDKVIKEQKKVIQRQEKSLNYYKTKHLKD